MKSKAAAWPGFSEGRAPWRVGLNTTGFHHINLLPDYSRSYHRAAKRLVAEYERLINGDGSESSDDARDMDAWPIIFLYRHSLELHLKSLVVLLVLLSQSRDDREEEPGPVLKHRRPASDGVFRSHDLKLLLQRLKTLFEIFDCSDLWSPPLLRSFEDLQRIVGAVAYMEYGAIRYPISMKKHRITQLVRRGLWLNLLTFIEKMDAVLDLLQKLTARTYGVVQRDALEITCHRNSARRRLRAEPR